MKHKFIAHSKIFPAWSSFCVHVFVQVFSHFSYTLKPTLPDPDPFKAQFSTLVKSTESVFQVSGGAMSHTTETPCSASSSGHLKFVLV